jgi:hypothetical protein
MPKAWEQPGGGFSKQRPTEASIEPLNREPLNREPATLNLEPVTLNL